MCGANRYAEPLGEFLYRRERVAGAKDARADSGTEVGRDATVGRLVLVLGGRRRRRQLDDRCAVERAGGRREAPAHAR